MVLCRWKLTLLGVTVVWVGSWVLEDGLMLEEEMRVGSWRYPSFSTFLFRVEFQWFFTELSVLRANTGAVTIMLTLALA